MALLISDITRDEVIESNRLDAKFYSIKELINRCIRNKKEKVIDLGYPGLIKEITDGEHNGQVFVDKGILFIKNSSIKDYGISLFDGFYVTEEKHLKMQRSALREKDILFTTIGHLGSTAIVPADFPEANINQNLVRIQINEDMINPYYLAAFLNSSFVKMQINCLLTGNIQNILTYPKIKSIKVIVPEVTFQKTIEQKYKLSLEKEKEGIEIIEKIKKHIRNQLKLDDISNNKIKSFSIARNDILNKKLWLPAHFNPKYDEIINYLRDNYECRELNETLAKILSGDEFGSDNYIDYLEKKEDNVPFIRTSDIYNYQIDYFPDNFIDNNLLNESKQCVKKNDIIFTNDGKIGELAMVVSSDNIAIQSHIKVIRSIVDTIPNEYIFAMLSIKEIGKYQCEKNTVIQSTIPTLANRLSSFIIPILSKDDIEYISNEIKRANLLFEERHNLIMSIQTAIESLY